MMNPYKKPDFWSQKAQKEGYPARSVYKLEEITRKFPNLIPKRPFSALDLGAAPGSWSLYLLRHYKVSLTACDLAPLAIDAPPAIPGQAAFSFIRGDFLTPPIEAQIREHGPYNLILSDAAPATSGNKALDAERSLSLAAAALSYAALCLEKGGGFAAKIFQGTGSAAFLAKARPFFSAVKTFKPAACRANSVEIYIIGTAYKGAAAL